MTRTVVETIAGATLAISSALPASYDQAGYESTDVIPTYTPVGQIENHGTHGVKGTIVEFTPVDTAVVAKMKGSRNYGTKSLTIGDLPGDAGQVILKAASESNNHYSVKITYPDGTVHYLDVIVADFEYANGSVNDVQKVNCSMALCRAPVIVAAA